MLIELADKGVAPGTVLAPYTTDMPLDLALFEQLADGIFQDPIALRVEV
jgi:hypothetical protein